MQDKFDDIAYSNLRSDADLGGVSRRDFLRHAVALGVSVSVAGSIWAGRAAAQAPTKGGTFRVGISDANTTDSLDPGKVNGQYSIQLQYASRSFLTEITPKNTLGPDAAESWETTPDGKTWRFKLYKSQTFHNGKAVTAKDVVASFNYHLSPESTSAAKSLLADVEDISADGDLVVVIKLKQANADLAFILSDYHLPICPADAGGNIDWASGIGSGPYKIERFRPGVATELSRHGGYHRVDQAFFEAVQMTAINDSSARQSGLMSGALDAINSINLKTLHLMKANPAIAIDEVAGGGHGGMPMNCNAAPFNNADVRIALKYAINRQEIVSKILSGHGIVANDQPVSPVMPYHADIAAKPYDPEKAKFHLKKAGMENLKVTLSTSTAAFDEAIDMATLYREHAAAAGIDLSVQREPADGYWSNVWLKKPFVVVNTGQRPTPDAVFSLFYKKGAAWNDTGWQNDRFQSLLTQAKGEVDDSKRAEMYAEMQRLCSDDGGTVIPFFANKVSARSTKVSHPKEISSAWDLDGGRAYQRWWFQA